MAKKKERNAEFLQWMGPLLDALRALGGSAKPREATEWIAENFQISPDVLEAENKVSGQGRFYNQVAWARQYLVWEGLLDGSRRGVWALTTEGEKRRVLPSEAQAIFQKWVRIHAAARKEATAQISEKDAGTDTAVPAADLPDEVADEELLDVLRRISPSGFERVCQRLLRESGFEKVTVTGRSHDGGIDGVGILQLNPFVRFKVLFQCKRYKGTVSRAEVGDFRNAMIGRADKGIILTTGTFSAEAIKEANRDGAPPVELVDGERLVEMFESVQLGVRPKTVYEVDYAFFEQFKD